MEAVKQGSCAVGLVVSQETSLLEAAVCMFCERQQFLLCTRQRMLSSIQAAAPAAGVHLVGRTFVSPCSVSKAVLMLVVSACVPAEQDACGAGHAEACPERHVILPAQDVQG